MANEIQFAARSLSGSILYAILLYEDGRIVNVTSVPPALEVLEADNWALYDIPLVEQDGAGVWLGSNPGVYGEYTVLIYERAGAAPAITDVQVGSGSADWVDPGIIVVPDEPDLGTLESRLNSPKKMRTDEGFVEERSVAELIEADRYLNPFEGPVPWGIRMAKRRAGGPVS